MLWIYCLLILLPVANARTSRGDVGARTRPVPGMDIEQQLLRVLSLYLSLDLSLYLSLPDLINKPAPTFSLSLLHIFLRRRI